MRLLSYHMLNSTTGGVPNDYRLKIEVKKVSVEEHDFEPDYLRELFSIIDWKGLVYASKMLGYTDLPDEFPDAAVLDSEDFLKKFHHAILELNLEEGALVCPETGRRFPVKQGVPNMIPDDNEMLLSDKDPMAIEGTQILLNDDKSNAGKKKKQARKKKTRSRRNQPKQIDRPATYNANVTVTYKSSSESSSDEFSTHPFPPDV